MTPPAELPVTRWVAKFSASAKLRRMDERRVVTAFLTRGNQVLLLRRTDRVRTYKGTLGRRKRQRRIRFDAH